MASVAGTTNLISEIVDDHRELLEVFDSLENTRNSAHRKALTDTVMSRFVRHCVETDEFLYPLVRSALPDGDDVVRHELRQQAVYVQVMERLERVDGESPEFETWMRNLMAIVRQHVEDEECDLLPRLRGQCDPARLSELGADFREAKQTSDARTFIPSQRDPR